MVDIAGRDGRFVHRRRYFAFAVLHKDCLIIVRRRLSMSSNSIQAFVSSTYTDLKRHRAHVIKALRKAGIFVDPMEDWTAESDEPKKFSQDRLAGCHFCVLLVAFRRGYVPKDESKSITQLEYEAAIAEGLDVLVYLLDESASWPAHFNELDRDPQIRAWRASLEQKHGRELFGRAPSSIDVAPAITRWVVKHLHPIVANLSRLASEYANHMKVLRARRKTVTSYLQSIHDLIQHAHDELAAGRVPHGTCQQILSTGDNLAGAIGDAVLSDDLTRLRGLLEAAYRVEIITWKNESDRQLNLAELDRTRGAFAALIDAIGASPIVGPG
jgi:hypothetical protein